MVIMIRGKVVSLLILGVLTLSSISAMGATRPSNWENKWWCDGVNWTYIVNNEPVIGFQTINDAIYGNSTYYFDENGNEIIGWIQVGNDWYYCRGERKPLTIGWEYIKGTWYYFTQDGKMASNATMLIDGKQYTFNSSGAWIK